MGVEVLNHEIESFIKKIEGVNVNHPNSSSIVLKLKRIIADFKPSHAKGRLIVLFENDNKEDLGILKKEILTLIKEYIYPVGAF